MNNMRLLFVDAETDGLYGHFITVAIIVTDEYCNELERYYFGIDISLMTISNAWVKEHVINIMGDYEPCNSENELLEKVWNVWERYRENCFVISDVMHPVESRLFSRCVETDLEKREFCGPFPLLDLSSMLYAKGYNPICDYAELIDDYDKSKRHNALDDVETMIMIYKRIMLKR